MKHYIFFTICAILPLSLFAQNASFQNPYVQLVPDEMKNSAGFVVVKNTLDTPLKIVRASSPRAASVELHTHTMENGVMRMRPVQVIEVPAKGETSFDPNGYHFMLIGLNGKLVEGEKIPITVEFESGESQTVDFIVRPMATAAMDHSQHSGHNHAGHNHNLADMVAPAGVMGAHMHHPGAWMIDYRAMAMQMNGLQNGTRGVLPFEVLYGIYQDPRVQMPMTGLAPPSPLLPAARIEQNQFRYMSTGTEMSMEMHMISAMYQAGSDTMLMVMVPYQISRMKMLANNFQTANMQARGVGDVSLSATFRVWTTDTHSMFLGAGIALPTGSIDEKDWMPQMGKSQVAYAMQPGAGTASFLPQVAYTGKADRLSWGTQFDGTMRAGKNDNNYRAGNRYNGTAWASWRFADWMSVSARVLQQKWENYSGQDPSLDPMMDPGNDPRLQGGRRTDVLAGVNLVATGGAFSGLRLLLEFGRPVRQHLNGPQMSTKWTGNFATQVSF